AGKPDVLERHHSRLDRMSAVSGRPQVASRADYLVTYAASCVTTICGMAAFRLAHQSFGSDGFAEYALTRRSIAFLVPLLSLGIAVAIPKFVACHASKLTGAT